MKNFAWLICVALGSAGFAAENPATLPKFDWIAPAPALPVPSGEVIRVETVEQLFDAAEKVKPGGTILVADGRYFMPRYFELHTDNVTLRSESRRRDRVILDGSKSRHGELVAVSRASGVTIADLTIQNVKWNGFKINSDLGATKVTIHNCVIHNVWQRGVKGPAVPKERRDRDKPVDCRIQYCLFYNDRPKRMADDETERFGGDYVGGIDAMCAKNWTISDNVFWNIHGLNRGARGAIFLWNECEGCVVERNVILDCDTGICLGNSHKEPTTPLHCTGCIVRNNFVTRCPENNILADYTRDCRILHNTIHDPASRFGRLIRLVHDNEGLIVANNLLSGPAPRIETQSKLELRDNLIRPNAGDWFADLAQGNLHLKPSAEASLVQRQPEAPEDFDRKARAEKTSVGADAREQ